MTVVSRYNSHILISSTGHLFHAICLRCGAFLGAAPTVETLGVTELLHMCDGRKKKPVAEKTREHRPATGPGRSL